MPLWDNSLDREAVLVALRVDIGLRGQSDAKVIDESVKEQVLQLDRFSEVEEAEEEEREERSLKESSFRRFMAIDAQHVLDCLIIVAAGKLWSLGPKTDLAYCSHPLTP